MWTIWKHVMWWWRLMCVCVFTIQRIHICFFFAIYVLESVMQDHIQHVNSLCLLYFFLSLLLLWLFGWQNFALHRNEEKKYFQIYAIHIFIVVCIKSRWKMLDLKLYNAVWLKNVDVRKCTRHTKKRALPFSFFPMFAISLVYKCEIWIKSHSKC